MEKVDFQCTMGDRNIQFSLEAPDIQEVLVTCMFKLDLDSTPKLEYLDDCSDWLWFTDANDLEDAVVLSSPGPVSLRVPVDTVEELLGDDELAKYLVQNNSSSVYSAIKSLSPVQHLEYACDWCAESPITGIRFRCTECPDYDLCGVCEGEGRHSKEHPMVQFRTPETRRHKIWRSPRKKKGVSVDKDQDIVDQVETIKQKVAAVEIVKSEKDASIGRKQDASGISIEVIEEEGPEELFPLDSGVRQWRLRNAGSIAIPSGMLLISDTSSRHFFCTRTGRLERIEAGQEFTVAVTVTAPKHPGEYTQEFRLQLPSGIGYGARVLENVLAVHLTVQDKKEEPAPESNQAMEQLCKLGLGEDKALTQFLLSKFNNNVEQVVNWFLDREGRID